MMAVLRYLYQQCYYCDAEPIYACTSKLLLAVWLLENIDLYVYKTSTKTSKRTDPAVPLVIWKCFMSVWIILMCFWHNGHAIMVIILGAVRLPLDQLSTNWACSINRIELITYTKTIFPDNIGFDEVIPTKQDSNQAQHLDKAIKFYVMINSWRSCIIYKIKLLTQILMLYEIKYACLQ